MNKSLNDLGSKLKLLEQLNNIIRVINIFYGGVDTTNLMEFRNELVNDIVRIDMLLIRKV